MDALASIRLTSSHMWPEVIGCKHMPSAGDHHPSGPQYLGGSNTQPLSRPGPQPWRPKTPINRTLAELDRHVPVRKEDQGWSADAR
eukprot:355336-Chlamydomonas_euryale.AAC.1